MVIYVLLFIGYLEDFSYMEYLRFVICLFFYFDVVRDFIGFFFLDCIVYGIIIIIIIG